MDAQSRITEERRGELREVVGIFKDLPSLQSAIDDLMLDGFDRSEISVLAEDDVVRAERGGERADELEDDERAPRLHYIESESLSEGKAMLVGGLFYIGAFIGAGVLTGVVFVNPIVAGAVTGAIAGLAGLGLSRLIGDRQAKWARAQLERGGLLLWARAWTPEREREAIAVMKRNGGHHVHIHAPA